MRTIIVILLLIATLRVVSSCYNYSIEIEAEKRDRALRLATPGSPLPDCKQWYDNGHSKEWAECMGVGYK